MTGGNGDAVRALQLLADMAALEADVGTSLLMGLERDAFAQPDGMTVVRYSVAPRAPGARTSLDAVLAAVDGDALPAFQSVATRLARTKAPLDFEAAERDIRRLAGRRLPFPAGDGDGGDGGEGGGVVGVVRIPPCPAVDRIMASRADDAENLATVMDARFLLVDGLGRPRAFDDAAAVEDAVARVQSKALAYYAVLLARQARLVRSARAAATFCVEGSQDERAPVAIPSRVFLPAPP